VKQHRRYIDFTGRVYGLWTVEQFVGWRGLHQEYVCRDIFGARKILCNRNFSIKDYGQGLSDKKSRRKRKILSVMYDHMLHRCYNIRDKAYSNYGGHGITVCEEWNGADGRTVFLVWAVTVAGWHEDLYIDRIDNDQGYSPQNCRFVTAKDSVRNRRSTCLSVELADHLRKEFKTTSLSSIEFCKLKGSDLNVSIPTIQAVIYNRTWR